MQKGEILAQSLLVIERLRRHRGLFFGGGALCALALATAVAVAPTHPDADQAVHTVIEQLSLNSAQALDSGDSLFLREEKILRGDNLGALLSRLGILDSEANRFFSSDASAQVVQRQLAPGKTVSALTTLGGELHRLVFPLNGRDVALIVERKNSKLQAYEEALRFESQIVTKAAHIRSSLFAATDAADIPDAIASQLADIFGGEIDFHRDLRKDDRFSVVYEMKFLRGQAARSGRILAAEFINNGKTLRAFWFEHGGKGAYYNGEGKNLRKAFLRSPLEFSRVTSAFSMRLHPILQEWRAHKGVDYGAPAGTKVRSTSDGTVDFVGRQGGYGNLIVLRHSGSYSTVYGHLHGFAPGLKKGSRVSQGDTIGFVGQTGWATGPHLHYEFRINNQQVNPLSISLPAAPSLETAQLGRFISSSQAFLPNFDLLREVRLVAID